MSFKIRFCYIEYISEISTYKLKSTGFSLIFYFECDLHLSLWEHNSPLSHFRAL